MNLGKTFILIYFLFFYLDWGKSISNFAEMLNLKELAIFNMVKWYLIYHGDQN